MKLKEFIGEIVLQSSKLGVEASELEIDNIEVGSIAGTKFNKIDIFIDERFKTISVMEGDEDED